MSACARPQRSSPCRQTDYLRDLDRYWCPAVHRRRQSALLMAPQLRVGCRSSWRGPHLGASNALRPLSCINRGKQEPLCFRFALYSKSQGKVGWLFLSATTVGNPLSARSEPARTRLSLSECANPCAPEARGSKHRLWKVSFRGRLDGACMTEREDQPAFAPTAQAVFDPLADIFRLLRLSRAGQQTGSPPRS